MSEKEQRTPAPDEEKQQEVGGKRAEEIPGGSSAGAGTAGGYQRSPTKEGKSDVVRQPEKSANDERRMTNDERRTTDDQ